jgi:hypothetical protein
MIGKSRINSNSTLGSGRSMRSRTQCESGDECSGDRRRADAASSDSGGHRADLCERGNDCGLSSDPNLLTGKRNGARRRWCYAEEGGKVLLEPSRGDQ